MRVNPYAPPETLIARVDTSVKPTRESLAATIRAFLGSEISAFEFDERLEAFRGSEDNVIRHVTDAVWYHYDDCKDHRVCFDKSEWDYFQRLLLVLSADCEVEKVTEQFWSVRQIIAAAALFVFTYIAFQVGLGAQLYLVSIPFGFISIALSAWNGSMKPNLNPYDPIISPFATFTDLARTYRSSQFCKIQYPKHLESRAIRSPLMEAVAMLQMYAMWILFSPIPLLIQSFPATQSRLVVRAV